MLWCWCRPGPAGALFNRSLDHLFAQSVSGVVWPSAYLAAGSFWNYQPLVNLSILDRRVMVQHNSMIAARGSLVCPTNCTCGAEKACGVPYVPAVPKPGPGPPPPPGPAPGPPPGPARPGIFNGSNIAGHDIIKHGQQLPQANSSLCAALCAQYKNCKAWSYTDCPQSKSYPPPRCWIKSGFEKLGHNDCFVTGIVSSTT